MRKTALRWMTFLLALLLIGPLIGRLAGIPRGLDGDLRAAPILTHAPVKGMALALLAVALTGAYACLTARRVGVAAGMNAAGVIFGWCAWNGGTIDSLLRASPGPGTLARLSLEAAVLSVAALVVVRVLVRISSDAESLGNARVLTISNAVSALAAVLVGAVSVALIAFEPLKGQAVFAALVGAIAVGAVTQLGAAGTGRFVPMLVPFAALAVLAVVAPLVAIQWHGSTLVEASRAGTLLGLAAPHGFDWLCGGFLGVPVGVAWAESMMERRLPASADAHAG
jgi:hypothetical protein